MSNENRPELVGNSSLRKPRRLLQISLSEGEYNFLRQTADQECISMSDIVRRGLRLQQHLKRLYEQDPSITLPISALTPILGEI